MKDVRWHPKLGHVVRQEVKSRDDSYVSLFFCKTFYVGEDGCCGWVSFFAFSIPQVGMACMDNLNYDQYIDHLSQVNIRISTKRNISAFHVTILRGSWRRTT